MLRRNSLRVNFRIASEVGLKQLVNAYLFSVDTQAAVLSVRDGAEKLRPREIKFFPGFDHDRAAEAVEKIILRYFNISPEHVAERHLGESLGHASDSHGPGGGDVAGLYRLMDI